MRKKGHKAWNKGLTKETDERVMKYSKKLIGKPLSEEHRKNIGDGNRGKIRSEETKLKIGKALKGNTNMLGKHLTEEHRRNIGESLKGKLAGEKHPNFGKHLSEEHRRNIGESQKGKIISEKHKKSIKEARLRRKIELGYINSPEAIEKIREASKGNTNMLGKHHTKETRDKLRESSKGNTNRLGKPHADISKKKMSATKQGIPLNQWEKFIAFEPYTPDFNRKFKKRIRERDFHCCQLCNMGEDDLLLLKRCLVIHHIDYNKLLSIPQNCITLCSKCNTKVNANRKQWMLFFQSLLKERHNYKYTQDQKIILDFIEGGR